MDSKTIELSKARTLAFKIRQKLHPKQLFSAWVSIVEQTLLWSWKIVRLSIGQRKIEIVEFSNDTIQVEYAYSNRHGNVLLFVKWDVTSILNDGIRTMTH